MVNDVLGNKKNEMDINEIIKSQRNRYPVLFVDKVTSLIPGKSLTAIKCFTYNEWYFPAHFDDEPNVPGFVLVECLVQPFILTFLSKPEYSGMKTNFANINNIKFKLKIVPGDILITKSVLSSFKRGIAKGYSIGEVSGKLACSAEFVVTVPEILNSFRPKSKINEEK